MKNLMKRIAAAALCLPLLGGFGLAQAADRVELEHDDMTLLGNLEMAPGSSVEDGVVLMVHGTLAHGEMEIMRSMQELLRDAGYNSLAINLSLGQDAREGMYDCDSTHRHKHEDAVDEIAAWVEWLKGEGAERLAVMGHSRGGNQVARYLADQADPMVEKAVLLAPQTWSEATTPRTTRRTTTPSSARCWRRPRPWSTRARATRSWRWTSSTARTPVPPPRAWSATTARTRG